MFNSLEIFNYKSIDYLNLECKKINLFIGKPNTGKSNILEAIDLSYLSWMLGQNEAEQNEKNNIDLKNYFRVNSPLDMFHLGNINSPIKIISNKDKIEYQLTLERNQDDIFFQVKNSPEAFTIFDKDFKPLPPLQFYASPVKPYRYFSNIRMHDNGNFLDKLQPPYGNNLFNVLSYNKDLHELMKIFAEDSNFEININKKDSEILIQLRINEGLVFTVGYNALADTFKRMLFYIAAIRHNNTSGVITFDEPDTHSFPPYVSFLAEEILKQEGCQFFITTHNPYLLNCLIEKSKADQLAIFICGFDKRKMCTTVNKLTDNDLDELLNYGIDIFFNLNRYEYEFDERGA